MNETQINAQFAALIEQRNVALNTNVNLVGELALLQEKVNTLTKERDAALALISNNTTLVENPNA